ncbi:MAG: bifunctional acetate--CoA ligase family protein/GNAT family N-acetyltransferase [Pseudorhodoplanes sp.]|nr:bifunctional acetate--CoA ligase family protein/GNAT family N-acetyltransferase [Pseudorhodoplanes sp.]
MSTYRLDRLLAPRSIAVVGASPRDKSVGGAVLRNLRDGGFSGPLAVVNPAYAEIDGLPTVTSLSALPSAPDVVVVTVPPQAVPQVVQDAAEIGASAAIIITAGLGHGPGSYAEAANRAARARGLRLIGPNCLGVIAPHAGMNASFSASTPARGSIALVSQSGAVAAGLLEWAARRNIGFSALASIGDQVDVDTADLLDFLALDRDTKAILLYIEQIKDARKFMSAARAAARIKPVVVMKAGRHSQGARAAATHTGALAGSDVVYDAAFRRAGLLRVFDLAELFDAAETLSRGVTVKGGRLAILTNGGGLGVLAIDRLVDLGGEPAQLSAATRSRLDAVLPPTWSKSNPVDIIGDADPARYSAALAILIEDTDNDAVLVLNVQTALGSDRETAKAVADVVVAQRSKWVHPKPVFVAWVGSGADVANTFTAAGIPHFETESDAVGAFMHRADQHRAIRNLMRTPPTLPGDFKPDSAGARRIVAQAIAEGRQWLTQTEASALMTAYDIPHTPIFIATTPEDAARLSEKIFKEGGAAALKILSPDIIHKSDVGGVRLNLEDRTAVVDEARTMNQRAKAAVPNARLEGFIVQPMVSRPNARELIVGIADDATFGPIVVFGQGGTAVEVVDDKTIALPPLDLTLAHEMIAGTRVARTLRAYRNTPAANTDAIALTIVKIAQMACDIPELRELDINPLLADEVGVLAIDARMLVKPLDRPAGETPRTRLAIRPYPGQWERQLTLADGMRVFVRPVRPEDEPLFVPFLQATTQEDLRLRFFAPIKEFGHDFLARLTQIDYARAMALVAFEEKSGQIIGVVRLHSDANFEEGEYAILLRSDLKGRGLGWKMMELIMEYGRAEGLKRISGQVLHDNVTMLRMCQELGFTIVQDSQDESLFVVSYDLQAEKTG